MSPVLGMVIGHGGMLEGQLVNNGLVVANIECGIPLDLDLVVVVIVSVGRIAHNHFTHDHLDFG